MNIDKKMRFFLIWMFLLYLCPSLLSAQIFMKGLFEHGQYQMPYRLLLPEGYDPAKRYPLVLGFHGAGERGSDNEITLKHLSPPFLQPEARQRYPCFVLIPQCAPGHRWVEVPWEAKAHQQPEAPALYMQMSLLLLAEIMQEYPIDSTRLYTYGLSMGGFAVWDIITRYPKLFAAAIAVCGGADEQQAANIVHLPVWAFHGGKDSTVLPERSRRMVAALQAAGATKLRYTEYPEVGHTSWKQAFAEKELLPWLFAQQKQAP